MQPSHWSPEEIRARHARQQRLCVALESIADALPDAVKPCMLARARALIADYLELVEQVDLRAESSDPVRARLVVDDLLEERRKDIFIAEEVAEALSAWSRGEGRMTPDAMGYLLRGLFDRLRQQMALESSFLARLTDNNRKGLH
jgi:hypothetical protein